tara:strand:+ start:595 stop:1263 length:669 start_codon:yes stop_codon:yes gene_type:complete
MLILNLIIFPNLIIMSIANDLWTNNLDLANSSYSSPFVVGIKNGDLPIDNFREYIAQDFFFLKSFKNAYNIALSRSYEKKSNILITELLKGVCLEMKLHKNYLKKWGVEFHNLIINDATKAYTDFLSEICENGSLIEILVSMTPCMRLYAWIGQSISRKLTRINNPYEEWIKTYADSEFEKLAITLEGIIDNNYNELNYDRLNFLYSYALRLEYQFFTAYSP